MMLDLESVRLFVLAVEFGNLTRAAEAAGTVQPAVSQRIKALEASLGRKLLDRTPRLVRPTEAGELFLARARALLAAHDIAIALDDAPAPTVSIGFSDHALGTSFEQVLRRLRTALPHNTVITLQLGQSHHVRSLFEAGTVDLAIVRREGGGADGEVLGEDGIGWRAPAGWQVPDGPLPVVTLPPPCGVRAVAHKALGRAGIVWRDAFVGGSCLALVSAVRAGLGIAPLGRLVGGDLADLGPALGLPPLPSSQIVLLSRTGTPHLATAASTLAASVRDSLR